MCALSGTRYFMHAGLCGIPEGLAPSTDTERVDCCECTHTQKRCRMCSSIPRPAVGLATSFTAQSPYTLLWRGTTSYALLIDPEVIEVYASTAGTINSTGCSCRFMLPTPSLRMRCRALLWDIGLTQISHSIALHQQASRATYTCGRSCGGACSYARIPKQLFVLAQIFEALWFWNDIWPQ